MDKNSLPLVKNDSWLEPVSQAVAERYERFINRMDYIQNNYGNLRAYASADQMFGFNYDPVRKGWWYRASGRFFWMIKLIVKSSGMKAF